MVLFLFSVCTTGVRLKPELHIEIENTCINDCNGHGSVQLGLNELGSNGTTTTVATTSSCSSTANAKKSTTGYMVLPTSLKSSQSLPVASLDRSLHGYTSLDQNDHGHTHDLHNLSKSSFDFDTDDVEYSMWYKTVAYCTQIINIIDVLSILYFYLSRISEISQETTGFLKFLKVLRMVRIFRITRILKKYKKVSEQVNILYKTCKDSAGALALISFYIFIGVLFCGSIIFICESGTFTSTADYPQGAYYRINAKGDREVSYVNSILTGIYWAVVTSGTIGYGDVTIYSTQGRIVANMCMYWGILIVALPITLIGENFTREFEIQQGLTKMKDRMAYKALKKLVVLITVETNALAEDKILLNREQYRFRRLLMLTGCLDENKRSRILEELEGVLTRCSSPRFEGGDNWLDDDDDDDDLLQQFYGKTRLVRSRSFDNMTQNAKSDSIDQAPISCNLSALSALGEDNSTKNWRNFGYSSQDVNETRFCDNSIELKSQANPNTQDTISNGRDKGNMEKVMEQYAGSDYKSDMYDISESSSDERLTPDCRLTLEEEVGKLEKMITMLLSLQSSQNVKGSFQGSANISSSSLSSEADLTVSPQHLNSIAALTVHINSKQQQDGTGKLGLERTMTKSDASDSILETSLKDQSTSNDDDDDDEVDAVAFNYFKGSKGSTHQSEDAARNIPVSLMNDDKPLFKPEKDTAFTSFASESTNQQAVDAVLKEENTTNEKGPQDHSSIDKVHALILSDSSSTSQAPCSSIDIHTELAELRLQLESEKTKNEELVTQKEEEIARLREGFEKQLATALISSVSTPTDISSTLQTPPHSQPVQEIIQQWNRIISPSTPETPKKTPTLS